MLETVIHVQTAQKTIQKKKTSLFLPLSSFSYFYFSHIWFLQEWILSTRPGLQAGPNSTSNLDLCFERNIYKFFCSRHITSISFFFFVFFFFHFSPEEISYQIFSNRLIHPIQQPMLLRLQRYCKQQPMRLFVRNPNSQSWRWSSYVHDFPSNLSAI